MAIVFKQAASVQRAGMTSALDHVCKCPGSKAPLPGGYTSFLDIDGVLLSWFCLAAVPGAVCVVVDASEITLVRFVWSGSGLFLDMLCLVPLYPPGVVGGVAILPSMSQLVK
jgi:hypothetical protein